jgi:heterodisulfide reductase subunit A-like polyferredoxin
LATEGFAPVQTARPGVYVAGPVTQPKDTRDTVTEAGAAVAAGRPPRG